MANEKKKLAGDVTAAGFLTDDKLLHAFVAGVAHTAIARKILQNEESAGFIEAVEMYVTARREGKSPQELAQILKDAIEAATNKTEKAKAIILTVEKAGGLIKIPNDAVSHYLAKTALQANHINRISLGIDEETRKKLFAEYVYMPAKAPANEKDEAEAFYDSCVEAAFCGMWKKCGRSFRVSLFDAYAIFTGDIDRDDRHMKRRGKYQRFIASCDRLINDSAFSLSTRFRGRNITRKYRARLPANIDLLDVEDENHVLIGGNVTGYTVTEIPPMLDIAEERNEMISVDRWLFEIKNADGEIITNSEDRTLIKYYLLRRIYDINHGAKMRVIQWEEMLRMIGASKKWETRERHKQFARDVLDYWVYSNFLQGWRETSDKKGAYIETNKPKALKQ